MPKKNTNKFQFRFVENILKNHRNAFAWLVRWGQGQSYAMVDRTMLAGALLGVLVIGVLIAGIGYLMNQGANVDTLRYEYSGGDVVILIGEFIITLCGLAAAIVLGIQLLRLRLLTAAVVGGNVIIRKEIELASAPLPGDRFDIGEVFTEYQASRIIKVTMSILAAIIGGAVYAAFIPVYTSPLVFAGCLLLVAFVAYGSAWVESTYWLPLIKKWSIFAAGILLLVVMPVRFAIAAYAPDLGNVVRSYVNIPKAEAKVKRAANDGDNNLRVIAADKVKALSSERQQLLLKQTITEQDIAKVKELNQQIEWWEKESYLESSSTPTSKDVGTTQSPVSSLAPTAPSRPDFVDAAAMRGVDFGTVADNSVLEITATGEAVWINNPRAEPIKYAASGPDGASRESSVMKDYEQDYLLYCPSCPKGALIGKIGNGPWFFVGRHYRQKIEQGGKLTLAINDRTPENGSANWADNSGGYPVKITR